MADILKTSHPQARAQERKTDAAYDDYEKAAQALHKFVTETHYDEAEARAKAPDQLRKLIQAKEKAHVAWQRQAMAHGHMFTGQDR